MRELILIKWCDVCDLDGAKNEATRSFTIGMGNGDTAKPVPKVLDVCEAHADPLDDMMGLLATIEQLPTPSAPPAKSVAKGGKSHAPQVSSKYSTGGDIIECQVCGMRLVRGGYVGHIWGKHRDEPRPEVPLDCPDCGEHFDNHQGAALHRKHKHGYDTLAEALSGVKGFIIGKNVRPRAIDVSQPELTVAS